MDLLWGIEKLIDEQLSIDTVQGYEPSEKMPPRKAAPKKATFKKMKTPQAGGDKSKSSGHHGGGFHRKKKKGNWRGDRGRNAKKY